MLTINISKTELKKAYFGKNASFSQEGSQECTPIENETFILLKIILENYNPNIIKEVA